jgi:hypothetical protein
MKMSKEYAREWKRNRRKDEDFRKSELEKNKKWREDNKEAISEQKKQYYEQNKEKIKQKKRELYEQRKQRLRDDELTLLVKQEAKELAKTRTKNTGVTWSVDHIVPMHGKNVSGLDSWSNIQVITLDENKRKYNKYEDCT